MATPKAKAKAKAGTKPRAKLAPKEPKAAPLPPEPAVGAKPGDSPPPPGSPGSEAKGEPKEPKAAPLPPEPVAGGKPGESPPPASAAGPGAEGKSDKAPRDLHNKVIIGLAILGVVAGLLAAYYFGLKAKNPAPVFKPVSNPYDSAIHANGMIESEQSSGENINIFPEVGGPITAIKVSEGQQVAKGALLFKIDDSVPRSAMELAEAALKSTRDQYLKRRAAYTLDPKSISKDVLDTAKDAYEQSIYALKAANALLNKYSMAAPVSGVVLSINSAVGSYVSSLGVYDSYTQLYEPLVVMGSSQDYLEVRCYVDEILVSRLSDPDKINAQMSVRGSDLKIPLEFVRIQPYVSPKIELSNERQEQVDLRVLPIIFRFKKQGAPLYPGQQVDVFIAGQAASPTSPTAAP